MNSTKKQNSNVKQTKEIPIIFSTEMVRSILLDIKTETRRTNSLKKFNDIKDAPDLKKNQQDRWGMWNFIEGIQYVTDYLTLDDEEIKCPYGKPGDLLYVRERFTDLFHQILIKNPKMPYSYYADCDAESLEIAKEYGYKWKPSIHMPKSAARIWLMVEDVRVERLNEITEEAAISEGVSRRHKQNRTGMAYFDYSGRIGSQGYNWNTAKESFLTLWESINGYDSWKENPWVWVMKFRVLSKTGRPTKDEIDMNNIQIGLNQFKARTIESSLKGHSNDFVF